MNISDRAKDLIAYFKIREGSDKIKRVEELAIKRDVAESVNDTDEVAIIDSELTNYGEKSTNPKPSNLLGRTKTSCLEIMFLIF